MPCKKTQGKEKGMRHIREVLRLRFSCGMGLREIGRSLRMSHNSVRKYVYRITESGLDWGKVSAMSDEELSVIVRIMPVRDQTRPMPDWRWVHQELKKPGVTLTLLWQEYKEKHLDGYQLTQFCQLYHEFAQTLRVTLRQTYTAGEVMFVDYSGQTMPIYDRETGLVSQAEIFVAVLGTSNYTFAEATADQSLPSWVGSHVHAFEYFDGVPGKTVSDNLKSGVTKPCRYEPEINRTYTDMIAHYDTVVIPARVRKPQDKAKVEAGVLLAQRWILAALRNQKFFSLSELNRAIRELLVKLNARPFQKMPGSRKSVYEELDRPALKPLPATRYEFAQWKKAKVHPDYHVELEGHYYSAPYQLVRQSVLLRYTATTVEILHRDQRVASHARDDRRGRHTTIEEHRPKNHKEFLSWTPAKIREMASGIGSHTVAMVETIMNGRQYPEQGYRSCLGIIRLAKTYSNARLEAACARGQIIGTHSYKSISSILKTGLDQKPLEVPIKMVNVAHQNIRGSGYFN
jgi:transposase